MEVGQSVEWNTLVNGKITRLKGHIKEVGTNGFPSIAVGTCKVTGQTYQDFIYKENIIK